MTFLFNENWEGRRVGIALLCLLFSPGCVAPKKPLSPPGDSFGRYRFRYEAPELSRVGVAQVFDDCDRTFINLRDPSQEPPSIKIGKRRAKQKIISGLITVEGVHREMTLTLKSDSARVINQNGQCAPKDSEEAKKN